MKKVGLRQVCLTATAFAAVFAASALANRNGPSPGFSGGPYNYGASCASCHGYEHGSGYVQINGLPAAYQPGEVYNFTVRVSDATQAGAGFELSVEADGAHVGTISVADPTLTQLIFDQNGNTYIGHTSQGVGQSVTNWPSNGGMVDYPVRWQAPTTEIGPVHFYAAGNAINNNHNPIGDIIYTTAATLDPRVAGDGDDDGDVDFADFDRLQQCFDVAPLSQQCALLDLDSNGVVDIGDYAAYLDAVTGPTALGPAVYTHADPSRGAKLYDKWWAVNGAPTPTGNHPFYPPEGQQSGSGTFRCKECHGWDYKGVDGAYGSGSHFTGIRGVFGTTFNAQQIFDLIKSDTAPNGHGMAAYGLTDRDIWDLTRFLLEFQVDTDDFIDEAGQFYADPLDGQMDFLNVCASCHGLQGRNINFGTPEDPEYIGTVATQNPWEFLHKVRAGQPGHPMPSFINLTWPPARAATVGAYGATLPTE